MIDTTILLGLGFILGLEHAFEPDHIVAVTSMISKHNNLRKTSILGAIWGLGHTTTLFIVGFLILVFKIVITDSIAMSLEFIVGIVIVILGIKILKELIINKKHIHNHSHNGKTHVHAHSHKNYKNHNHYHQSYVVGLVHGMAGSAALMLLVLSTLESTIIGLVYIFLFGIGSMVGMILVGIFFGMPFVFTSKRFTYLNKSFQYIIGIFSICFGIYLMIKVGFLDGLFII